MKFLNQFIFVFVFATLAVFINQSYSLPNASEAEIAEVEDARIVKRGIFDCPHNCWGKVERRNARCPNRDDHYQGAFAIYGVCFCCK